MCEVMGATFNLFIKKEYVYQFHTSFFGAYFSIMDFIFVLTQGLL